MYRQRLRFVQRRFHNRRGREGLELPTSSTENIILDDVLKLNNSDFVKIAANGDYMFNKDGDEATPSHPYINKIWVEKANVNGSTDIVRG